MRRLTGGERYEGRGVTLKRMIEVAYNVGTDQVEGGPAWFNTNTFDLDAKGGEVIFDGGTVDDAPETY